MSVRWRGAEGMGWVLRQGRRGTFRGAGPADLRALADQAYGFFAFSPLIRPPFVTVPSTR